MSLNNIFDSLCSGGSFKRAKPTPKPDVELSISQVQKGNVKAKNHLNFFACEERNESKPPTEKKTKKNIDVPKTSSSSSPSPSSTNSRVRDEEIAAFRRRLKIRIKGDGCPPPISCFTELPFEDQASRIKRSVLEVIEESTWREPTPVQMQAIPALCSGRDVVVSAPTGSGKTAAFLLPSFIQLSVKSDVKVSNNKTFSPRVLLIAPTRELANQIHREAVALSSGSPIQVQLLTKARVSGGTFKAGFHGILVSTPMRLVASLRTKDFSLSSVEIVVLDEADRLFELGHNDNKGYQKKNKNNNEEDDDEDDVVDAGFLGQIDEVLAACDNPRVQRALFSATMGDQVSSLVDTVLRTPIGVMIGHHNAGAVSIEQRLIFVGREEGKLLAFRQLIQEGLRPPVLVFVQSKERAKELFHELVFDGINVDIIHADRSMEQRDEVIKNFRLGKVWVLLCTDLLGRGVDFKGLNMVVNFDFPSSAVSYIHRIGRTGRAGRQGLAVTFFTEHDMQSLRSIANVVKLSGGTVPDWMLSLKNERRDVKRRRETGPPPGRDSINTAVGFHQRKNKGKGKVGKGNRNGNRIDKK